MKNEGCHSFKAVFSIGPQSRDLFGGFALQEPGRALPCEDGRRRVKGRCEENINTDCKAARCGFYKWSAREQHSSDECYSLGLAMCWLYLVCIKLHRLPHNLIHLHCGFLILDYC